MSELIKRRRRVLGCRSLLAMVLASVPVLGCASARPGKVYSMSGSMAAPSLARIDGLGPVMVASVIDARPSALKTSSGSTVQLRYSVLAMGSGFLFVDGARVEGATYWAGDKLDLRAPAGASSTTGVLSEMVAAVIHAGSGQPAGKLPKQVSLGDADKLGQSLGVADGVVIVPILDQFDVASLASTNSMAGGSSYEVSRSTTEVTYRQTAGATTLSSTTAKYANVRARLAVYELRGGAVVRQQVVYARGQGSDPSQAIEDAVRQMHHGLQQMFGPPPAPPVVEQSPAPDTTLPEPVPVEDGSPAEDGDATDGPIEALPNDSAVPAGAPANPVAVPGAATEVNP